MVSVRSVVRALVMSVALLVLTTSSPVSAQKMLNALDNVDLLDLLDAELDESLLAPVAPCGKHAARVLQSESMTSAPTPAPTTSSRDFGTSSPTVTEREMTTSPTASPPVTSGVWRPVPSMAIALAAVVLAVLAGGAFAT